MKYWPVKDTNALVDSPVSRFSAITEAPIAGVY
jgi:hypothetical protein